MLFSIHESTETKHLMAKMNKDESTMFIALEGC